MTDLRLLAERYFRALSAFDVATLKEVLHPSLVQYELPNRLNPKGQTSTYDELFERFEKSRGILSAQTYTIEHVLQDGNRLALEVAWTGTVAIPLAGLPVGGTMRASF